jgi:hypothetical protein
LGEQCYSLEIDTIQFNFSECHPPRLRLKGGRPESDTGQPHTLDVSNIPNRTVNIILHGSTTTFCIFALLLHVFNKSSLPEMLAILSVNVGGDVRVGSKLMVCDTPDRLRTLPPRHCLWLVQCLKKGRPNYGPINLK